MDKEIHAYFRRVRLKDRLLFNNMAFRLSSYRLRVWWRGFIASFLELRHIRVIIVLGQELDKENPLLNPKGGDDELNK